MWLENTYINISNIVTIGPYIERETGEYGLLIDGIKYKVGIDLKIIRGETAKIIKSLMDTYIIDIVKEIENEKGKRK